MSNCGGRGSFSAAVCAWQAFLLIYEDLFDRSLVNFMGLHRFFRAESLNLFLSSSCLTPLFMFNSIIRSYLSENVQGRCSVLSKVPKAFGWLDILVMRLLISCLCLS